jgi:hypothetical protein
MISRIKGVLRLESETFREIEHDSGANGQAALVVIIASLLNAFGAATGPFVDALAINQSPLSFGSRSPFLIFLGIAVWSIVAWLVWAAAIYIVGAKIFSGKATYGEMLRVTGFAYAPMALMILAAIPCIGFALSLIITIWTVAAIFIGVREGLDLGFGRTLITVLVGWIIYGIGMAIIGNVLGLF